MPKRVSFCVVAPIGDAAFRQCPKIFSLVFAGMVIAATSLCFSEYGYSRESSSWIPAELEKLSKNERQLHMKAAAGDSSGVRRLIRLGVDVSAKDKSGQSPLAWAVSLGHADVVQLLLEAGADANARGESGTVLMYASFNGDADVVALLLKGGADVGMEGENGLTALTYAIFHGHTYVTALLLKAGADVNAKVEGGRTPLMIAVIGEHSSTDIAELLIKAGADVNAENNDGRTALEHVVYCGRVIGDTETLLNLSPDQFELCRNISQKTRIEHILRAAGAR